MLTRLEQTVKRAHAAYETQGRDRGAEQHRTERQSLEAISDEADEDLDAAA